MGTTQAQQPAPGGQASLEASLALYFAESRPWYSKVHARLFPNKPYVITATLLFGWMAPAFGITEYLTDWWFFESFAPQGTLLTYLVTTCLFCLLPLLATTAIHWWEEKTFLPIMRDLKTLVTSYKIHEDSSGLEIDESTKYERFVRRKITKCFRYVNSVPSFAASFAIATFFLVASILNTARPGFVFLWNYIPAFFMVLFGSNVIIGILPYHFVMNDILKDVELKVEPEHPDGIGGLSPLKELAINTAGVVATIAFAIPWLISLPRILSSSLEPLTYVSLAFIPLIVYAIAYVFFKPTFALYRRIKVTKDKFLVAIHRDYLDAFSFFQSMLQGLKRAIADGKVDPGENPVSGDIVRSQGMLVEMLKDRYEKAKRMKEWPISTSIVSKLVGSMLVPVVLPMLNPLIQLLF